MIQIGINLQTNDLNQCCRIRIIGIFTVWIRKLLTKRNVLTFLIALFKGSQIANRIKMTCSDKKFTLECGMGEIEVDFEKEA